MRAGLLLAFTLALAALPYLSRTRLLEPAGPKAAVFLALTTLLGLTCSGFFLLATLIDPVDLPAQAIPDIVGQCLGATTTILSHPLTHWPRIAGAILLAGGAIRFLFAIGATLRNTRRGLPPGDARHEAVSVNGRSTCVTVVADREALAYTVGLLRPRIVVSEGLLSRFPPAELAAVIAHEEAHVAGRHTVVLFAGRVVDRAFGFLPPMRRAVKQLTLGLEVMADDHATEGVADPLIVANALVRFADPERGAPSGYALGAAESDVLYRTKRLTTPSRGRGRRRRVMPTLTVVLGCALFVGQLLALPAGGETLTPAHQRTEIHGVCHLPHGEAQEPSH